MTATPTPIATPTQKPKQNENACRQPTKEDKENWENFVSQLGEDNDISLSSFGCGEDNTIASDAGFQTMAISSQAASSRIKKNLWGPGGSRSVKVGFSINNYDSKPVSVSFEIVDRQGALVKTIFNHIDYPTIYRQPKPPVYKANWNGKNNHNQVLADGVYFTQISFKRKGVIRKIIATEINVGCSGYAVVEPKVVSPTRRLHILSRHGAKHVSPELIQLLHDYSAGRINQGNFRIQLERRVPVNGDSGKGTLYVPRDITDLEIIQIAQDVSNLNEPIVSCERQDNSNRFRIYAYRGDNMLIRAVVEGNSSNIITAFPEEPTGENAFDYFTDPFILWNQFGLLPPLNRRY